MADSLSTGSIERLASMNGNFPIDSPLTLQIISRVQLFPSTNTSAPPRYRCIVSDGRHSTISVLSGHVVQLIDSGAISRYSVIKVTKANVTRKQANPADTAMLFLIVVDAQLVSTLPEKVGDPQPISGSGNAQHNGGEQVNNAPAPAAPAPPPAQQQQQSFGAQQQQQQPQKQQMSFGTSNSSSSFMSRVDDVKPGFSAGGAQAPVRTGPAPALHPIRDLNPYHNKWTIRARVSQKSGIKTWNKPNSQGRLFSVNLIDESGEIRATAFTQQVDQFYPILEVGKVYYLSNARVTVAKKNFSNVNNEYELIFDGATEVQQCLEQAELPQMHFDFIALSRLMSFEKGHVVDILGVVRNVSEATEITSRNNPDSKMTKRELTVVDKSGYQVRTTLWGDDALSFSASGEPVIAFKGVRVGDFGGRTLSLPSSGTMMVNPDIPEAHALRGWYDAEGRNASYQSYGGGAQGAGERGEKYESQLKTMAQVRDENIGMGDAAEYFYLKGTIVFIRNTTIAYPSCPAESCNKKVVEDQTTGQWRCEKCERSYPAPEYRYIFSINVSDETGQNWLQCFNDIGEQLLGCSANDMVNWQQNNEALFNKKLEEATFKQQKFRCRAKSETFNDTTRVRISVMAAYPIDFVTEAKRLSRLIESYA